MSGNKHKLSLLIITLLSLAAHLIVSSTWACLCGGQLQVTANNAGQRTDSALESRGTCQEKRREIVWLLLITANLSLTPGHHLVVDLKTCHWCCPSYSRRTWACARVFNVNIAPRLHSRLMLYSINYFSCHRNLLFISTARARAHTILKIIPLQEYNMQSLKANICKYSGKFLLQFNVFR